jgi:aerobic carbon-monoxide dehydrogenase medium subunit
VLVKPAPFTYHAPETLDEALVLLSQGEAQVLAGGQSLVPLMKLRVAKPSVLVDVNRIAELAGISNGGGVLRIGATTRQQALVDHETAARSHPLLRAAAGHAGYLATRHRGTVGGSLAFAAPWAELTAAAVALDARIHLRSASGERIVEARSFFHGPHRTALVPGELLTEVTVPAAAPRTGAGFHEATTGHGGYLHAAAAATVTVDEGGRCEAAELVTLGVGPAPSRLDVAPLLAGTALEEDALAEVDALFDDLDAPDGVVVSGAYRRNVARVLARRALADAHAAVGGAP